ncbi:MAG TPA: hypothetical protein VGI39_01410 [Polyangiaceae bacterium]
MKPETERHDWIVLVASHIAVAPDMRQHGGLMCLRCGETHVVVLPARIDMVAATGEAFEKLHRVCKPHPDGDACTICLRRGHDPLQCPIGNAKTAEEWIRGPDTGLSSKTIWSVMMGNPLVLGDWGPHTPSDASDFGRCYRLLKVVPAWRAHLHEVAAKYPKWTKLVEAWDELSRLYEEEIPKGRGRAPKLYAKIKECTR